MRIYTAGPMTGYENYNFPAFDKHAAFLRELGHDPVSPADLDREHGWYGECEGSGPPPSLQECLRWDFAAICTCDAMAFMPGWVNSTGSNYERTLGRILQLPFYHVDAEERTFEPEIIVGIAGYARSGKDSVAKALVDQCGFRRAAFADSLKDLMYAVNPIINFDYNGEYRLADLVDHIGWERAKEEQPEVRPLLQRLGTEGGRALVPSLWVDVMFYRARGATRLVIPDCRFPNEYQAVKNAGGQMWRVERPGTAPANGHTSETALDGFEFDQGLFNGGSLEDLYATAVTVWEQS